MRVEFVKDGVQSFRAPASSSSLLSVGGAYQAPSLVLQDANIGISEMVSKCFRKLCNGQDRTFHKLPSAHQFGRVIWDVVSIMSGKEECFAERRVCCRRHGN